MTDARSIVVSGVSRYYGEILGVRNVTLDIRPGVTSLVGPNGAGKTTLLNLMAGLLVPTSGTITVHGLSPSDVELFPRVVGYATQFDSYPKGITGAALLGHRLLLFGRPGPEAREAARAMLHRVGLAEAAGRRVATYSKGMRQRLQLAAALIHDPQVLILDEPLNGLDPMARAEFIRLFRDLKSEGRVVLISSHILEEVDQVSDHAILMDRGSVVAEGQLRSIRSEIPDQPATVWVRCDRPALVAQHAFEEPGVVEVRISEHPPAVLVRTREVDLFYRLLNRIVLATGVDVEQVSRTDDDTFAVYGYLLGREE
jgi:ABC-2 type transport system ATP-binding protein